MIVPAFSSEGVGGKERSLSGFCLYLRLLREEFLFSSFTCLICFFSVREENLLFFSVDVEKVVVFCLFFFFPPFLSVGYCSCFLTFFSRRRLLCSFAAGNGHGGHEPGELF